MRGNILHRKFQQQLDPEAATNAVPGCSCVSFGGWMTNAPTVNAQDQAPPTGPQRREWKKPVLDILALADAEAGRGTVHDAFNRHKSG